MLLYRSNPYLILQTEIPQFILEAGMASYNAGAVAVTQPRRVAAVNLAKRVAEETFTTLGKRVSSSKATLN
jgi:HrpA-like RNA helicase